MFIRDYFCEITWLRKGAWSRVLTMAYSKNVLYLVTSISKAMGDKLNARI